MDTSARLTHFDKNYSVIAYHCFTESSKNEQVNINYPTCRFCEKTMPDVSFKKKAHAINEFLGNKWLIVKDECDSCNENFGMRLEDHLSKLTKPMRTLAKIKGKKGIPAVKSFDKKSEVRVAGGIKIKTPLDSNFCTIDEDENVLRFKFEIEPFVPIAAYKALVKMGLSLIKTQDELDAFKHTKAWLLEDDHSKAMMNPLRINQTFFRFNKRTPLVAMLFRRKPEADTNIPYCSFVIGFGHFMYQLIIPSHFDLPSTEGTYTKKINNVVFPSPHEVSDPSCVDHKTIDLSSSEKKSTEHSFSFKFESMEIAKPPTDDEG